MEKHLMRVNKALLKSRHQPAPVGKRSKKRARKGNQPTAEKVAAVFNLSPLKMQSPAS